MKTKLIGIFICMLLIGTVLPASGTVIKTNNTASSNRSGNILYVGGSGEGNYSSIQDAIDDAVDGDTVFVYDDSSPYYEFVVVNKSINLIGENRETTVIDGGGSGFVCISADGVTISGFTIRNESFGINIRSNSNTITSNTITSNSWYGIDLHYSSGNTITGNTISLNNKYGIRLFNSVGNTILKNNFIGNKRAAFFYNNVEIKWERNTWKQNYWNRPRVLPKLIFGEIEVIEESIFMPWFNIDWHPAQEPYDI